MSPWSRPSMPASMAKRRVEMFSVFSSFPIGETTLLISNLGADGQASASARWPHTKRLCGRMAEELL